MRHLFYNNMLTEVGRKKTKSGLTKKSRVNLGTSIKSMREYLIKYSNLIVNFKSLTGLVIIIL